MGMYNSPSEPPAPDYAAANVAGINADAATLPFRLRINQAAQNGGVYTAPDGKVYDFRGNFDADRFFAQNPQAKREWDEERAKGELQGWTPQMFASAFMGGNDAALTQFFTGSQAYRNQSDIDSAIQLGKAGADISDASARRQLQTQLELLPEFNALNLKQQEAAVSKALELMPKVGDAQRTQDTATFNNNLALGQNATRSNAALQTEILPGVNDLSLRMQEDAFKRSQDASKTAFAGNLDLADTAANRAVASQQKTMPQLNDLALKLQQTAFDQNLNQADSAGRRATSLQKEILPGLNDLGLRLQSDAYRAGDTTGRQVNGGLYAIRDQFEAGLLEELKAGGELTAAQRNKVQQRIRGAQASRANILGDGAAFDEAIAESDYSQNLVNDRRAAALGLINARDLNPNFGAMSPVNPTQVVSPNSRAFDQLMNPTQVVSPNLGPANFTPTTAVNPLMPNFAPTGSPNLTATTAGMPSLAPATISQSNPLGMLNPNAGNNAASYGLSAWNTTSQQAGQQQNPWATGLGLVGGTLLGSVTGGLGTGVGAALGSAAGSWLTKKPATTCWVARVVLGTEDEKWRLFRAWLLLDAPAWFRACYLSHGERFANWLANKPRAKALLRPWFAARAESVDPRRLPRAERMLEALSRHGSPAAITSERHEMAEALT